MLDPRALRGTVAVVVALLTLHLLPPGGAAQRASDVLQVGLGIVATWACARAAARGSGDLRLFWLLIATSTFLWTLAQLLFTLESSALVLARASGAQRGLFLLAAFPLALAGLVRPDRPTPSRSRLVLDLALLAGLSLFVYFYGGAGYRSPAEPEFVNWRQATSHLEALLVAATLFPLAGVTAAPWRTLYRRILAAGLLWFVGNAVLSGVFVFSGRYRAGLLDIPWTLPFVWIAGAAAAWPPAGGARPQTTPAADPWRDTRRGQALALAAVTAVPAVHLLASMLSPMDPDLMRRRTFIALVALVVLVALFVFRQRSVMRGAEALERRREEELSRVDARFEKAFRTSPARMAIVRRSDGVIVDVNDRYVQRVGVAREAAVGTDIFGVGVVLEPALRERVARALAAGHSMHDLPLAFHARSGEIVDALVSFEIVDVGGESCVLVIGQDRSERRRLEQTLIQAQRMEAIGRLGGGIAHEFNNLLTVIMAAGALALDRIGDADAVRSRLGDIDRAAERATGLTRQLMTFGRRPTGAPEWLDLGAVLEETRTLLERVIGEDVVLTTAVAAALPRVRADRGAIRQVIMNLATNARDAMPQGGRLDISLTVRAGVGDARKDRTEMPQVVLEVRDEGVGMSDEVQRHLFEPFFTTKHAEHGGLGLATVYGLVAAAGGRILVTSSPGQGTRVTVAFPGEPRTDATGPRPEAATPA